MLKSVLPVLAKGKSLVGKWSVTDYNNGSIDQRQLEFYANGNSSSGVTWSVSGNVYTDKNGSWRLAVSDGGDTFEFIPEGNQARSVFKRIED